MQRKPFIHFELEGEGISIFLMSEVQTLNVTK